MKETYFAICRSEDSGYWLTDVNPGDEMPGEVARFAATCGDWAESGGDLLALAAYEAGAKNAERRIVYAVTSFLTDVANRRDDLGALNVALNGINAAMSAAYDSIVGRTKYQLPSD